MYGTSTTVAITLGGNTRFAVDSVNGITAYTGIAMGTNAINFNGATIRSGNGTPEGSITASVGSLFLRLNGGTNTTLYVKESGTGNTGWVAK